MQVRGSAEPEERFDFFRSSEARFSENDIPRNDECHLGTGVCRAIEAELTVDSLRTLPHSLETEMPLPAFRQDSGFHANPIVTHAQRKVLRVGECDFQFASPAVLTGIVDGFVTDAIDLVARDRVHISAAAILRELNRH